MTSPNDVTAIPSNEDNLKIPIEITPLNMGQQIHLLSLRCHITPLFFSGVKTNTIIAILQTPQFYCISYSFPNAEVQPTSWKVYDIFSSRNNRNPGQIRPMYLLNTQLIYFPHSKMKILVYYSGMLFNKSSNLDNNILYYIVWVYIICPSNAPVVQ